MFGFKINLHLFFSYCPYQYLYFSQNILYNRLSIQQNCIILHNANYSGNYTRFASLISLLRFSLSNCLHRKKKIKKKKEKEEKRESESITEIEFDRRHDSRLVDSSPREGNGRKWEREGKEEEEARIVHRARDVSPRSRDHPPFYFYFSGQIYRSFTHSCSGSAGQPWEKLASVLLLFFPRSPLFRFIPLQFKISIFLRPRIFLVKTLYIYIYLYVWGITHDRYKKERRGKIKQIVLLDIFKFENIQFSLLPSFPRTRNSSLTLSKN